MNCRFKLAAGMAAIALLALTAGVCLAGQGSAGDGTSAVSELLRLLQAKGVVTSEEAGELEKKFDHGSPGSDKTKDKRTSIPAGKTAKTTVSASSDDKIMETIESLAGQSVISSDEKAELTARADVLKRRSMGKSVPGRQKHEVGAEEIDYGKTTVPVEEIRDQLRFLAYREIVTREEAANAYRRFGNNYTAAEAGAQNTASVAMESKSVTDAGTSGDIKGDEAVVSNDEKTGGKVPFAYGEVIENIDALADQGIFNDDETDELKGRADLLKQRNNGEKVQERRRRVVGKDKIPYRRTTIEVDEVKDGLRFLTYQGIMTRGESTNAFARLEKKNPTDQLAENISDELAWEVRSQVAQKMDKVAELERKDARLPEWLERINIGGDLRLRYERDFFDKNNGDFIDPSNLSQVLNSHKDQNLVKTRARLNLTATVNDYVQVGIGLATGNTNNPVSTNATLGTSLNKQNFLLDLAYFKWTPTPDLTLWGGRFANPWFHTDLVWDPDINFDGVAFSYRPKLTDSSGLFLTGGAFPIQSMSLSSNSKWLYGGQLGAQVRPVDKLTAKLGVAFYDFENTVGIANNPAQPGLTDWSAPQFQQKGNTLFDIDPSTSNKIAYASAFKELNITGSLDLGFWDPVHVNFTADYVNNIGFDQNDVNQRTGISVKKETVGYQFGVAVGYPTVRNYGEWKGFLCYKYLGSDAVMDAFTDSDFHLGGTNAKGWILGAEFGLAKNVWLSSKWLTTNEISGPPFAIDTFFFDLNAKF